MKLLSSSIIVCAGAALLLGGAFVEHDQSGMFVQAVGGVITFVGLIGWWLAYVYFSRPDTD